MGNDVVIYTRQNKDIDGFSVQEKAQSFLSAYYSWRTVNELEKIIKSEKPDFAMVQNVFPLLSPSVYVALVKAGIPTIQAVYNYRLVCPSAELFTEGQICERCLSGNTIHAVIHRCYRDDYFESAWYASVIGWHRYTRTFANDITSFMVPDNFLGSKLSQGGIPEGKIWTNPNPFFVNEYTPNTRHQGYVLFVGRLVRQKGILTLLKAMEYAGNKCRLVVVGRGDLEGFIQHSLKSSHMAERIEFLGTLWGKEVDQLIENCAAVIIPSEWYDNLPMILCRANALGKPVIASRINGIPEYVQEGVNGFLFEPGNAIVLADHIDRVMNLSDWEYQQFSSRSRRFAEDTLDYSNHYRNLMNQVQSLL
jgi:glycosyltransferase involved in cell wall biosynthesis